MNKKNMFLLASVVALVSMIAVLGLMAPVRAVYMDESDVWSTPNGYAHAYVRGSFMHLFLPYSSVHHEADIFECLKGRYHFWGEAQNGTVLYSVWGVMQNGVMHVSYDPPYHNVIFVAYTDVWAPYSVPPNPYMEFAEASIGPPGVE